MSATDDFGCPSMSHKVDARNYCTDPRCASTGEHGWWCRPPVSMPAAVANWAYPGAEVRVVFDCRFGNDCLAGRAATIRQMPSEGVFRGWAEIEVPPVGRQRRSRTVWMELSRLGPDDTAELPELVATQLDLLAAVAVDGMAAIRSIWGYAQTARGWVTSLTLLGYGLVAYDGTRKGMSTKPWRVTSRGHAVLARDGKIESVGTVTSVAA